MGSRREVTAAEALRRLDAGDPSLLDAVPVDLSGLSPFAAKVYGALRKVPPGTTVTYAELARRAGSPGAARAVGRAMATNPHAPFVPCHRVVGSGGSLTGYSAPGGIAAKKRLLEIEARWAAARGAPDDPGGPLPVGGGLERGLLGSESTGRR